MQSEGTNQAKAARQCLSLHPNQNVAIMLFFGIETYLDNNQRTVQEVDSAAIAKTQETKMQSKLIENLKT